MKFTKKTLIALSIMLMSTGTSAVLKNGLHFNSYQVHPITAMAAQKSTQQLNAKHNSGTMRLPESLKVGDSQHGNNVTTIPKGQVVHYKKAPEGFLVWNKKYPSNSQHHYVATPNDLLDAKSKSANAAKNKGQKGTSNIAKANQKAHSQKAQQNAKARARQQAIARANAQRANHDKRHLPRTSDSVLSNTPVRVLMSLALLLVGTLANASGFMKKIYHNLI